MSTSTDRKYPLSAETDVPYRIYSSWTSNGTSVIWEPEKKLADLMIAEPLIPKPKVKNTRVEKKAKRAKWSRQFYEKGGRSK